MSQPTLYLLLGYPGAGKTTVSRELAKLTGAVHVWADHERRTLFVNPTHSKAESDKLYSQLNQLTDQLLISGQSVIFDTSFNHFSDREHLRAIAKSRGARTILLWLDTPRDIAKARATRTTHAQHNNYATPMSSDDFERIAGHLEPPHEGEKAVRIDGTNLEMASLHDLLNSL